MKIFIMVVNDCHADVDVTPFRRSEVAVERARALALEYAGDPANVRESDVKGWFYHAEYSDEGDSVWVIERELE